MYYHITYLFIPISLIVTYLLPYSECFADLKPDNVGFTSDGTLKLFDFGLCTCVKTHSDPNDVYEMTGNTGSLRYMAPEVALRKPYNEKVDVYSYGIMVWQMARDRVPFKGLSKTGLTIYTVLRVLSIDVLCAAYRCIL